MPLIDDNDLVRIDLPTEGEWVEVKRALSAGDRQHIQGALMRGQKMRLQGDAPDAEFDMGAALEALSTAKVSIAVKRWSFDLPVTIENLRKLDEDSWAYLVKALDERYPGPRSEEEKKGFSGSGQLSNLATLSALPQS